MDTSPNDISFLFHGTELTPNSAFQRFRHIEHKLLLEKRYLAGSNNLIKALGETGKSKKSINIENQLKFSRQKQNLLKTTQRHISQLGVPTLMDNEFSTSAYRCSGMLRMMLISAKNMETRTSSMSELYCIISIDGEEKFRTRVSSGSWDIHSAFKEYLVNAIEVEICVMYKETLLGMQWFNLKDIDHHLQQLYSTRPENIEDFDSFVLQLENFGQITLRIDFKTETVENLRMVRKGGVQKVYPRNGHLFTAKDFGRMMKCAFCSLSMRKDAFHCKGCNYAIHQTCCARVNTKCIASFQQTGEKMNANVFDNFNIPHRWSSSVAILPCFCGHCGEIMLPGKKLMKCTECSKYSHRDCHEMFPNYCGLTPDMSDKLSLAMEHYQKKLRIIQINNAENERMSNGLHVEYVEGVDESYIPKNSTIMRENTRAAIGRAKTQYRATQLSIDDFHLNTVLGRGGYGKVILATDKKTNQCWAIKAVKKASINERDIEGLMAEKLILQLAGSSNHPFLVNLHSSFSTANRVYFVMEYISVNLYFKF
jgi:hypothetical protein